jgi:hypothetical protein
LAVNIIQTITADSPPGYTKLNPLKMISNMIAKFLFDFTTEYDLCSGQVFLESTSVRNLFEKGINTLSSNFAHDGTYREFRKQQGPSVPFTVHVRIPLMPYLDISCDVDLVIALPYISSPVLDSWSKRDRYLLATTVCLSRQERNLLLGKGKPCDITQLKYIISNLLDTGGFFIIMIEKLKVKIVSIGNCLTGARRFSEIRDKFEIMFLRMNIDIGTKVTHEIFFQSSFLYDVGFEVAKDPLVIDLILTVMKFLNLDLISLITNPQQTWKAIKEFLFS